MTTPAATQSTSVWLLICDLLATEGPGGEGCCCCCCEIVPGGCCCESRRSLLVLSRRDVDKEGGGDEEVEALLRVACISTVLLKSPNERCENLLPEALHSTRHARGCVKKEGGGAVRKNLLPGARPAEATRCSAA